MRKQVQVVKKLQASAALAALAFSLGAITAAGAWADTAVSGAVNGGAAAAGGHGKSKAEYSGGAAASTSVNGGHNDQADAASVAASKASQKSQHSSAKVSGIATANAHAEAVKGRTLKAYAEASVAISGRAKQPGGVVVAGTVGHSKAYAISKPGSSTAVAQSDSGGYAAAVTGPSGYRVASVDNGVVQNGQMGKQQYEIAYNSQGDFSIAVTTRRTAQAFTGSTSDVGALANGNLRVILSSGTFAGAYADPFSAAAFAGAYYGGFAQTAGGFASVNGAAFAYAAVEVSVPPQTVVSCSFNYPLQDHLKQKCRWPQPED